MSRREAIRDAAMHEYLATKEGLLVELAGLKTPFEGGCFDGIEMCALVDLMRELRVLRQAAPPSEGFENLCCRETAKMENHEG